eukprot:snap_masked-scaffold_10-processed-gene-6.28-mRNA-1 protein AED:1.00 eAED:1.00 QI:0/0/0/0/1/1/6/0/382
MYEGTANLHRGRRDMYGVRLLYDDLVHEEQAACRTAFRFNSECEVRDFCSTELGPLGKREDLKPQPFKEAELACLKKVLDIYRIEPKRYCPSWSAGVNAIYGHYVTYSDHPNALTDFLGCVMQWTNKGRYSRYIDECSHLENLKPINKRKISEFNYVTHFLDHMFMKNHPASLLIIHINWYRFQYCYSRGISFQIKLPADDGNLKMYTTTIPSDNQFAMNLVKLDSYILTDLRNLANAVTYTFKKVGSIDNQIQGESCFDWNLGFYRREIYYWKEEHNEILKEYYKSAWGIDSNQQGPGKLSTLANIQSSSSITANSKTKDKEGECEAVELEYYNCDLQCGSAQKVGISVEERLQHQCNFVGFTKEGKISYCFLKILLLLKN